MKKRISIPFFFILFIFLLIVESILAIEKDTQDLSESYKKWLDEEVVYIITPKEKEVFLKLATDRERNLFIEAFWKHRDPNPNTTENEFKKEHYRRITYVNNWFGRESPSPGWKTDMGRIYLILGEPNSIDKFENLSEVYPMIIWFYQGKIDYGLPNAFNVVFFKRRGMGEYELYSPIKFGPQKLLIHFMGDPTDYRAALEELLEVEPSIAEVALSLIPEESKHGFLTPSIASELLISNKIPSAPYKKVEDTYAEKLLKYKDVIEVEYSANYIDNDSSMNVIQDQSGMFFVHFVIEPRRLTFEKYENKYHTTLDVNGIVANNEGKTIYQYQRSIPIEFSEDQFNSIQAKLFSFQDMFPLIAGEYRINLLLKNSVSKEFTTAEAEVLIPKDPSLKISSLILANRIITDSKYRGKIKPFMFGDAQLIPSPRNDFSPEDSLYLFFQIYGLDKDLVENGLLDYSIFKEEEKVFSKVKKMTEYQDKSNFIEEFSLRNFSPAYYRIKVSLLSENREEITAEQSRFYISPLASVPRPWILSFPQPPSENPLYHNIEGIQFLNKKDFTQARSLLEKAYRKEPNSVQYALDFCTVLLIQKEFQRVNEIAAPFLTNQNRSRFLLIVGQSYQALGELNSAISYYKEYLSHQGTNLGVLNRIGDCYFRLGAEEEAINAWERSLEINPNQEEIKTKVTKLKKT
jgi:GWxTD domain-containing protein